VKQVPVAHVGVAGQVYLITAEAVGFKRDPKKKQPHIFAEMQILDEQDKPMLAKPAVGDVDADVPENEKLVPLPFTLPLNRPGKFNIGDINLIRFVYRKQRSFQVSVEVGG